MNIRRAIEEINKLKTTFYSITCPPINPYDLEIIINSLAEPIKEECLQCKYPNQKGLHTCDKETYATRMARLQANAVRDIKEDIKECDHEWRVSSVVPSVIKCTKCGINMTIHHQNLIKEDPIRKVYEKYRYRPIASLNFMEILEIKEVLEKYCEGK